MILEVLLIGKDPPLWSVRQISHHHLTPECIQKNELPYTGLEGRGPTPQAAFQNMLEQIGL